MARLAIAYVKGSEAGADTDSASLSDGGRLDLVAVVRDEQGPGRNGLAEAMRRIVAAEASVLVAARLNDVAGSLRELVALLNWLHATGAELIALDIGLDTGAAAGWQTAAVLREVERWEREPESAGRPLRGRPGLAVKSPELSKRIAAMRKDGLSLQAIADALNHDGVPTQRGGSHWRPSSVQAVLGYRRPQPPLPGAPPPPLPPARYPHPPRPPGSPPPPRHRPRHKP